MIRGEAVARKAAQLSAGMVTGMPWDPDLIIGHPGWGEMLFLGDIWPETPQLHYVEFFHGVPGTDNDISDQYATKQNWEEKARADQKYKSTGESQPNAKAYARQLSTQSASKLG